MMYYSEHHTPWENSDDKSEHIGSVSFILCTFVAHIHIYLHPLNNKGKQGISMAWFVIISELERNLGKHIPPGICNAPYASHTLVFSIPEHTHSQTFWAAEETSHGSRTRDFTFSSSECRIYPLQGRVFREETEEGRMTEGSGLSNPLFHK